MQEIQRTTRGHYCSGIMLLLLRMNSSSIFILMSIVHGQGIASCMNIPLTETLHFWETFVLCKWISLWQLCTSSSEMCNVHSRYFPGHSENLTWLNLHSTNILFQGFLRFAVRSSNILSNARRIQLKKKFQFKDRSNQSKSINQFNTTDFQPTDEWISQKSNCSIYFTERFSSIVNV